MRRVMRQVRSLCFDFLHRRRQLEGQSSFGPGSSSKHVEKRCITDAKIRDERPRSALQLSEDRWAIEVHRHASRNRRSDALDLLELRIAISETEIAFMPHRSEHVVRMQSLKGRVRADDGNLGLGEI